MRVVLEGPDNAGKTSLAQKLRMEVTDLTYYHPGGAPNGEVAETDCLDGQAGLFFELDRVIFDRVTCVSQQVYNPNALLDPVRQHYAEQMLKAPDLIVIYCRPPNEVLMDVANFKWRAEETEEHRQKIISRAHEFVERYDQVMQKVPCISYDWKSGMHAATIERKLVQGLNGRQDAVDWFKNIINLRY
jgi:thymidylate kinase